MVSVGVLALQGSVAEHAKSLSQIEGVEVHEVRYANDLEKVSGLIIPGGESTTLGKLIKDFGLYNPIIRKAAKGMPIWGTCAGMILVAKKIVGEDYSHLGLMDISVRRNAYGSQLDSFKTKAQIAEVSCEQIPLIFIRAPWIEEAGKNVEVMAKVDNKIVAARQGNIVATSFHPELTEDLIFHKYFVQMVKMNTEEN